MSADPKHLCDLRVQRGHVTGCCGAHVQCWHSCDGAVSGTCRTCEDILCSECAREWDDEGRTGLHRGTACMTEREIADEKATRRFESDYQEGRS